MTASKIVLASSSPRRRQLLAQAGYNFIVAVPGFEEPAQPGPGVSAEQFARELALGKAESVADDYPENLVIGADTLVDCDGKVIGKARDAEQARAITAEIFSRAHKVITALAVLRRADGVCVVESDTTVIYPRAMSSRQLDEHISRGNWKGKAGAYGIKEQDDEFIERIEGSLSNVMGMLMEMLAEILGRLGRR